jgi:hypothetical protein
LYQDRRGKKYKCTKTEVEMAMVWNEGQRENPGIFYFIDKKN